MSHRHACIGLFLLSALLLAGPSGCINLIDQNKHKDHGGEAGGGGGAGVPGASTAPVNVLAPGTVDEETFDGRRNGGYFVGADGIPRLAYLRINDSNANGIFDQTEGIPGDVSQVMYVRRRADGTWTTPIAISAADADFKENPVIQVVNTGVNIAAAFIFWRERTGGLAEVHVARVDAGDPPLVLTADSVISDGTLPVGMLGGSGIGSVTRRTLTSALDSSDGSVYAAWAQFFSGGECVVYAKYNVGGAGLALAEPNEKVGVTTNVAASLADVDEDAAPGVQLFFSPAPAVGTGGTMHVLYVSTDEAGVSMAVRSRTRTAPATMTPAVPGDVVSDVLVPFYRFPRVTSEGDGDVYVGWTQGGVLPTNSLHHAYHPVTSAVFDPSVVAVPTGAAPTGYGDLAITLDQSTPVMAYKRQNAPGGVLLAGGVVGSPNLSGPFAPETILHAAVATTAGEGPGRVEIFREASFQISVVYDAPPAAGSPFDLFGVVKPSTMPFGAESNRSLTAAVVSRLVGSAGISGTNARFVYLEGPDVGPRDVFGLPYAAGTYLPVVNLSVSAPTDSHGGENGQPFNAGNVGVFGVNVGTPTAHIWWREHLGVAQHDPFYVQQQ